MTQDEIERILIEDGARGLRAMMERFVTCMADPIDIVVPPLPTITTPPSLSTGPQGQVSDASDVTGPAGHGREPAAALIPAEAAEHVCDLCGEPGELRPVEDSDPDAGYLVTIHLCEECRR